MDQSCSSIPRRVQSFLVGSTIQPKEMETFEGKEYPVVRVPVSSASHPFFTKATQFIDAEGRVDKFTKNISASASKKRKTRKSRKKRKKPRLKLRRSNDSFHGRKDSTPFASASRGGAGTRPARLFC